MSYVTILAGLIFVCKLDTIQWKCICLIDKDLFGVCVYIFYELLCGACIKTKRVFNGNIYSEYCCVSRIYVVPGQQLRQFQIPNFKYGDLLGKSVHEWKFFINAIYFVAWIKSSAHIFLWYFIIHPNPCQCQFGQTIINIQSYICYYTLQCYVDVITYPWHKSITGAANISWTERLMEVCLNMFSVYHVKGKSSQSMVCVNYSSD